MFYNDKEIEVVEIFDKYVIIQVIESGSLMVVDISELLDYNVEGDDNINEISNIVSFEEYKRCLKRKQKKKKFKR